MVQCDGFLRRPWCPLSNNLHKRPEWRVYNVEIFVHGQELIKLHLYDCKVTELPPQATEMSWNYQTWMTQLQSSWKEHSLDVTPQPDVSSNLNLLIDEGQRNNGLKSP